ncbi:HNH endonuclease [Bdellovibrio sp. HCB185ZH]|uniref:HNH endonuclease n=1 Tax=Bdellovibrio sp. HCB185ZH TaxID=3394235 RepID=UPI0039A76622
MADKIIKQKSTKTSGSTATVAVDDTKPCCQYVDHKTGRRCHSTWKLQLDHKQSRWAGGSDDIQNLQWLCAGHNKLKYRQETGLRYIS